MKPGETHADAVVIGSALGGLVAAAILSAHGKRVVVLEHADSPGGRCGAVRQENGWWIDFGHRDGHDVGDCQLTWHAGVEAAREAGVEIRLRRVTRPLRLHRYPEDVVLDGDWSAEGFLRMARDFFECPDDGLDELTALLATLASPVAAVEAAIPQTLGTWLPAHVRHPGVRRAVLLMAAVIFHRHPGEASVGRLMQFFQTPKEGPFIPDDDEAGGMQGLIEPWVRALRSRGVEIALGWKPVEIVLRNGRAEGAVAVDRTNLVHHVHAPVVISTYPVWEMFDLCDERSFPREFVSAARELQRHRADLVGWQGGLRSVPIVRSTGRPDDHPGWNRFLRGAEREYRGGYQITSLSSRRAAPEGKHLLELVIARWFRGGSTAGQTWSDARAELDEALAYLRRFYADLDECIEWSAYQYVTAPQTTSWYWAPLHRHGVDVPGIVGLFLASSTVEAPAGIVDLAAWAGREAARRALALLDGDQIGSA